MESFFNASYGSKELIVHALCGKVALYDATQDLLSNLKKHWSHLKILSFTSFIEEKKTKFNRELAFWGSMNETWERYISPSGCGKKIKENGLAFPLC